MIENYSLQTQLLSSFMLIASVAGGVTIAICLAMVASLKSTTISNADYTIIHNTRSNALNLASEISASLNQQLQEISQSICKASAQHSSLLILNSQYDGGNKTLFAPFLSFPEYNFIGLCDYPRCPYDYGPLHDRSRIPYLPGFVNGSVRHSSVYLYSGRRGASLRNDSEWNQVFEANEDVYSIKEGLSYIDTDFDVLYNRGSNITVMFYLSTQVFSTINKTDYFILHRTFPGILKNSFSYNPSNRPWFQNSVVDGINLYGPYVESFTKQFVITLSSRKSVVMQSGASTEVVAAAVLLIQDIAYLVNAIEYSYGGFGALITWSTNQVLVWGNDTNTYNYDKGEFKTVQDFDPVLNQYDLTSERVIEYTSNNGDEWLVTCNPVFISDSTKEPSLVVLVFSNKELAFVPLRELNENVDNTTKSIYLRVILVCFVSIGVVLVIMIALVLHIVRPLQIMCQLSAEVVRLAGESEETRDYSDILNKAGINLHRTDEVGLLACDYYNLICLLQNNLSRKKKTPRYPSNPFYCPELTANPDSKSLTWKDFFETQFCSNFRSESCMDTEGGERGGRGEEAVAVAEEDMYDGLVAVSNKTAFNLSSIVTGSAIKDLQFATVSQKESPSSRKYEIEQDVVEVEIRSAASTMYMPIAQLQGVGYLTSLRSQLLAVMSLLLGGMIIAMIITIVTIRNEGLSWTTSAVSYLTLSQVENLRGISFAKSFFVKNFFAQLSLELLVGSKVLTQIMDRELNRSSFMTNEFYLPSYSIDALNPYSSDLSPSTYYNYSGYFAPGDAGCYRTSGSCDNTWESFETRLTSLMDLKLRSYYYHGNFLSFLQLGLESTGFTRYLPYQLSLRIGNESTCVISSTASSQCANLFYNSKCSDPAKKEYPAYDARCRSWYQLGVSMGDPSKVYFQYPRVSSSGQYVLTGVIPIRSSGDIAGKYHGTLISNYLMSTLSTSINSLTVLKSGYCYLVDARNATNIIVHPKASSVCSHVDCSEGFSSVEYRQFYHTVLSNIEQGDYSAIPETYVKAGRTWRITVTPVSYSTIRFSLVITVPEDEVLEAATDTQRVINASLIDMMVVFIVLVIVFSAVFLFVMRKLIQLIVHPVEDLRKIFERAHEEDYSCKLPEVSTSYDMKILLGAFSQLFVALRFGSESYAVGNKQVAYDVFTDALRVFSVTNNERGVGASLNNLAAVEMSDGNYCEAEELYLKAIKNAEGLLETLTPLTVADAVQHRQLRVTLSDRQGNLAILYLEANEYDKASSILKTWLEEDKRDLYIKGYVLKQCSLSQYHIKHGELLRSEEILSSTLSFIRGLRQAPEANASSDVETQQQAQPFDMDEWHISEQIVLFNMAVLEECRIGSAAALSAESSGSLRDMHDLGTAPPTPAALRPKKKLRSDLLEHLYLNALCGAPVMHAATTHKVVSSLTKILPREEASQLTSMASQSFLELKYKREFEACLGEHVIKQVGISIDYSGSMAGEKILYAVENTRNIFIHHIKADDSLLLMRFNKAVDMILPMTKKKGNEEMILSKIHTEFATPSGSTRLYDAINLLLEVFNDNSRLETDGKKRMRWAVLLTDGQDNGSKIKLPELVKKIHSLADSLGLIIIGIGRDVEERVLRRIVNSAQKGEYIYAEGNKASFAAAFGHVAQIILGDSQLEDI